MNDIKLIRKTGHYILFGGIVLVFFSGSAFGQANVDQATLEVSGAYKAFIHVSYAVSAIMCCIGAIKVFSKLNNGDPDARRSIVVWLSAMAIAVAVPLILDSLYGSNVDLSGSLNTANTTFRKTKGPAIRIMTVLMAILGLIGGARVYKKWTMGDEDTRWVATYWVGALIFYAIVLVMYDAGIFGTF